MRARATRPGQTSTRVALEFISDSAEVVGDWLRFNLNYFTGVTSLLLQFPVGDTYKFDVILYDDDREMLHTEEVGGRYLAKSPRVDRSVGPRFFRASFAVLWHQVSPPTEGRLVTSWWYVLLAEKQDELGVAAGFFRRA